MRHVFWPTPMRRDESRRGTQECVRHVYLWLVPVIFLAGCGYAGEPKPPALLRPMKATDLAAMERGAKIIVTFTLPPETTEGMPIAGSPDVEMRVGVLPDPWNQDTWAANSDRIPMSPWHVVYPAPGAGRRPPRAARSASGAASGASGATGMSGKKSRFGFIKTPSKPPTPVKVFPVKSSLYRSVEVDASKYIGKTVVIGLKVHGPQGRDDGWSTVSLEVLPVLLAPRNLRPTDGPNAVHLEWAADAPGYRIFRKLAADTEWTQIGESTQNSFDDKTFDYGKTWQYYVESVRKVGDHWLESDASETISFAPVDRFPPAVPAGLIAIAGTHTVELVWDAVTDADLAGYRVYRNGVKIADAVMTASYSDKDVVAGMKYSYQVSAVDAAGNESKRSGAQDVVME